MSTTVLNGQTRTRKALLVGLLIGAFGTGCSMGSLMGASPLANTDLSVGIALVLIVTAFFLSSRMQDVSWVLAFFILGAQAVLLGAPLWLAVIGLPLLAICFVGRVVTDY
jgi:hypothetical protein